MCDQFRRTEEEDESGSDWDEMTPRTTTTSPAPILPLTTTTITTTADHAPSPGHTPDHTPLTGGKPPHLDTYAGGASLRQPPVLEVSEDQTKATLLAHDPAQRLIQPSTRPARKEGVVSLPNKVHWNSSDVGGMVLEDELTPIATVKTPQPPPLRPVPPTAYRVAGTQQEGEEQEGEGGGIGQRSPGRRAEGVGGDHAPEVEENYR